MTENSPKTGGPGVLQGADRALLALLSFTERRPEWGVSEIAREHGWDKAVAQRILATLTARAFLTCDSTTRRYRLGPAVSRLARVGEHSGVLPSLVRPVLAGLLRETGESVVLNVPNGSGYRCAAAVDGTGPVRYTAIVGALMPGHAGASGHAIFAHYPEGRSGRSSARPHSSASTTTPSPTSTTCSASMETYGRRATASASASTTRRSRPSRHPCSRPAPSRRRSRSSAPRTASCATPTASPGSSSREHTRPRPPSVPDALPPLPAGADRAPGRSGPESQLPHPPHQPHTCLHLSPRRAPPRARRPVPPARKGVSRVAPHLSHHRQRRTTPGGQPRLRTPPRP